MCNWSFKFERNQSSPDTLYFLVHHVLSTEFAETTSGLSYGHQTQILKKEKSVVRRRRDQLQKHRTSLFHRGLDLPLLGITPEHINHGEETQIPAEETEITKNRGYILPPVPEITTPTSSNTVGCFFKSRYDKFIMFVKF